MSAALRTRPLILAGTVLLLSGCTSLLGGNIKGNFACSAPGGSCAPSSLIDDQALSVIQNARPMTPTGMPGMGEGKSRERVTALSPMAGEDMLHQGGRTLRIVFPGYVDGNGNYHEPRIVHAQGTAPSWVQLATAGTTMADQMAGQGQARAVRAFAPVAEQGASLSEGDGAAPFGPPSQAAVDAARAKALTPPLDAIKAEVKARLAPKPVLPAAPMSDPVAGTAPVAGPAKTLPLTLKTAPAFPGKVE